MTLRKWAEEPYDEESTRRAMRDAGARGRMKAVRSVHHAGRALSGETAHRAYRRTGTILAVLATCLAAASGAALAKTESDLAGVRADNTSAERQVTDLKNRARHVKASPRTASKAADGGTAQVQPRGARDKAVSEILDIQNSRGRDTFDRMRPLLPGTDPANYQGNVISPFSVWAGGTDCTWTASNGSDIDPDDTTTVFVCTRPGGSVAGYAQARWAGSGFSGMSVSMDASDGKGNQ